MAPKSVLTVADLWMAGTALASEIPSGDVPTIFRNKSLTFESRRV